MSLDGTMNLQTVDKLIAERLANWALTETEKSNRRIYLMSFIERVEDGVAEFGVNRMQV
tara:strand:- start:2096 stop:2272 length:177 start_codon:yes stop_codon:yes gene_type:complete